MIRKSLVKFGIIVLLLSTVASSAFAVKLDGPTIIRKMFEAEGKTAFTAHEVTTLSSKPPITSEQIVYRSGFTGTRFEYTAPPALRGEVRADDGKVCAHLIPRQKTLRLSPSRLAEMKKRTQQGTQGLLKGGLNAKLIGRDRVAGRPAYVVEVRPKRLGNTPIRKFWVDEDKWVKLKTEDRSSNGALLSTSYYTKIDYVNSIPSSKFRITPPSGYSVERQVGNASIMSLDSARKSVSFKLMEPTYLPKGYKAIGAKVIQFRRSQLVAIRYSNGVNSVSLFQAQDRILDRKFLERMEDGPIKPGRGIYSWREGRLNMTLIGQLSESELKKIAESVK